MTFLRKLADDFPFIFSREKGDASEFFLRQVRERQAKEEKKVRVRQRQRERERGLMLIHNWVSRRKSFRAFMEIERG